MRTMASYDGSVAMGVILTDDVTDDTRGFLIRLVVVVGEDIHREQHPAMHRLQAVPHIGQRPADDDTHCVSQIGLTHLSF